ncbi:diaminopimelate decarboxylase [Nostocoides jenkinsii]|uniref:Diaminopimelate decarboxylase n=1 Tax=Nostocoides jenkinsii Ben 74 TaxID=1193518 RepID=A0A077MGR6_9MICO|nr:diaminopimelate decarboxylase [Tetrasphaera jenkinsii]CCI55058.1 Diaminopimelate decarboxylase [Tetrasphaera jenkinsii Ben 74]
MRAHEAGVLHADGYGGPPIYLPYPDDVMALTPAIWSQSVRRREDGALEVGGVDVRELAAEHGTAAYVLDEDDFRTRARAFRDEYAAAFDRLCGGADVYYAGKAFLCAAVARWVMEEGLSLDVCTGGELAVAQRVGFPGERIGFHGNNKTVAELRQALTYGVGRIVVDSYDEIDRVVALARELGVVAPVMLRVTVGVEAHTHEFIATGHEDQKFGFSLGGEVAFNAAREILAHPAELHFLGLHSHIGSQIFDTSGFDMAAQRLVKLHQRICDELGYAAPEIDLGGGYGIAYTSQHTPLSAAVLADEMAHIVEHAFKAAGDGSLDGIPKVSIEPGRAIVGPAMFTLYEVGTVKPVVIGDGQIRTYVSIDGGMSDNARPALYDADFSVTLASRNSTESPIVVRVVGRHCEAGDIVVQDEWLPGDVRPGDLLAVPGTGAYCRALSSQYNHTPRPPVIAVHGGRSRVLIRRETIDDLLGLDLG